MQAGDAPASRARSLVLLRHGHALEASDDFSRELSPRGVEAARNSARELSAGGFAADLIATSSAPRARTTAEIVAEVLGFSAPLQVSQALYLASPEALFETLTQLPDSARSVLLVAHNPGLSTLASHLTGTSVGLAPAEYRLVRRELAGWSEL